MTQVQRTVWAPERLDALFELWAAGHTAGAIADKLGERFPRIEFTEQRVRGALHKYRHELPAAPVLTHAEKIKRAMIASAERRGIRQPPQPAATNRKWTDDERRAVVAMYAEGMSSREVSHEVIARFGGRPVSPSAVLSIAKKMRDASPLQSK